MAKRHRLSAHLTGTKKRQARGEKQASLMQNFCNTILHVYSNHEMGGCIHWMIFPHSRLLHITLSSSSLYFSLC